MKKSILWMLAAAAMVAVGCSDDNEPAQPLAGKGKARFALTTSDQVATIVTRATQGYELPEGLIPAAEDFSLKVTGTYTDHDESGAEVISSYFWGEDGEKGFADWEKENPDLEAGEYNLTESLYENAYQATVTCGDLNEEGEGKPYFAGQSAEFNVRADLTADVSITAKLANSCFTLAVTEWMLNYYTDISLTITTEAGKEFTFTPTTTDASTLIFVKPEQTLKISGTATKAQNGAEVEFPLTAIGNALAAETHYTIEVTHSTAGGGNLTINFDDTFTEVEAVESELNSDVQ